MCLCKTCASNGQPRCPYQNSEIPSEIQTNGCAKYIKQPKQFNVAGMRTKCIQCRYLFRKPREEQGDKSFIVCGAIPSQVKKIQPIVCCPNYKPLRKKQAQKRMMRGGKAPYQPKQFGGGRQNRQENGYAPRDNRNYSGGRGDYGARSGNGGRMNNFYRGGNGYRG